MKNDEDGEYDDDGATTRWRYVCLCIQSFRLSTRIARVTDGRTDNGQSFVSTAMHAIHHEEKTFRVY